MGSHFFNFLLASKCVSNTSAGRRGSGQLVLPFWNGVKQLLLGIYS